MPVRTMLLTILGGAVAMCATVYFTAVTVKGTSDPEAAWWPGGWVWVLFVVAGLSAIAWVLIAVGVGFRGSRPVMRLTLGMGNSWTVENLTRKPLLDARYMGVRSDSTNMSEHYESLGSPDFEGRGKYPMGQFEVGSYIVFTWIRDDRRRHAEVRVREGAESLDVIPEPLPSRRERVGARVR